MKPWLLQILVPVICLLCGTEARAEDDLWSDLKMALFPDKVIENGAAFMRMTAPERAHDAAIVPVQIDFDRAHMQGITLSTLTLIVDKNPAPVAAVFRYASDRTDPSVGVRIRVNEYTDVHAVAETSDGRLFEIAVFVKAAGGCSAPANKNPADAEANRGEMKLKRLAAAEREGSLELLIRHPNYSGMQMDQVTRHYIPADYVEKIDIRHDGELLLSVEGNISLSENPAIQFYLPGQGLDGRVEADVMDSAGRSFRAEWPVPPAG
ncbi:quinoprotein dehydrogenase-associated SoxYZ-like carrier [Dongia sp.]|uniref:quinoprotein dehydrogenase-associated SoxYZ-like carrier n=1 Tax=Dongia sp. TaxID=1977262 RepID=UPI0035B0B9D8